MAIRAMVGSGAIVLILSVLTQKVHGHAFMSVPIARNWYARITPSSNVEYCPHCKSGGGVGGTSGIVSPFPYPETVATSARHGLCGDPKNGNERYLANGPITQTYTQGQTIDVELTIRTHHRGHMEMFLCDLAEVTTAEGVVTQECLNQHPLHRDPTDTAISPIDTRAGYEGRYYLEPVCAYTQSGGTRELYNTSLTGAASWSLQQPQSLIRAKYMLPENLTCTHCVLQMWWITGNSCNAPGYRTFSWPSTYSSCSGDGPGMGWWGPSLSDCTAGFTYPEEFWNCADIAITGSGGTHQPTAATSAPPPTTPVAATSATPSTTPVATTALPPAVPATTANFSEALRLSMLFYDAQRTGVLPAHVKARVPWRENSFENDGSDVGLDLSGGFFDAGDYIKYGFPAAGAMTMLAWGAVDFGAGYSSERMAEVKDILRWYADYIIRCHPSDNVLFGQVGNTNADHSVMGRPENFTGFRPSYNCTTAAPCSDLAAETAAALSAIAMLWNSTDAPYAATLVGHATSLYAFASNYRGRYHLSITDAQNTYPSSDDRDELGWGGVWLYRATGQQTYLTQAQTWGNQVSGSEQSWDDKTPGLMVLLNQASPSSTWTNRLSQTMTAWLPGGSRTYTPQGFAWYSAWGSLRYTANMVFVGLAYAQQIESTQASTAATYRAWGLGQIEYILGNNSNQYSYLIGYGSAYPRQPHHKASTCAPYPAACTWATFSDTSVDNHYLVQGALIGGPNAQDVFVDDRTDYQAGEVSLDYNAGFSSALAALNILYPSGTPTPAPSSPPSPPTTAAPTGVTAAPTTAAPVVTQAPTSAAPTATPPTSAPGAGGIAVSVTADSWGSGCQLGLDVTFPEAVTSWDIVLTFGPTVPTSTNLWNAETVSYSSGVLVLRQASYNGVQNAGDSVVIGMNLYGSGVPSPCFSVLSATLNGVESLGGPQSTVLPDTTASPTTSSPVTSAPVTSVPATGAPVTSTPATAAPVTSTPATAAPVTSTPTTVAPVTSTPTTAVPVTSTPVSPTPSAATTAPISASPVTASPATSAPVTSAPVTSAPVTSAPSTTAPVNSAAPTTVAPTTADVLSCGPGTVQEGSACVAVVTLVCGPGTQLDPDNASQCIIDCADLRRVRKSVDCPHCDQVDVDSTTVAALSSLPVSTTVVQVQTTSGVSALDNVTVIVTYPGDLSSIGAEAAFIAALRTHLASILGIPEHRIHIVLMEGSIIAEIVVMNATPQETSGIATQMNERGTESATFEYEGRAFVPEAVVVRDAGTESLGAEQDTAAAGGGGVGTVVAVVCVCLVLVIAAVLVVVARQRNRSQRKSEDATPQPSSVTFRRPSHGVCGDDAVAGACAAPSGMAENPLSVSNSNFSFGSSDAADAYVKPTAITYATPNMYAVANDTEAAYGTNTNAINEENEYAETIYEEPADRIARGATPPQLPVRGTRDTGEATPDGPDRCNRDSVTTQSSTEEIFVLDRDTKSIRLKSVRRVNPSYNLGATESPDDVAGDTAGGEALYSLPSTASVYDTMYPQQAMDESAYATPVEAAHGIASGV